jgi:hypothetical protein
VSVVEPAGILPSSQMGRMTHAEALTTPMVAKIDDDDSLSLSKTADVLMHAFGLRRAQCTLVLRWTVRTWRRGCSLLWSQGQKVMGQCLNAPRIAGLVGYMLLQ